MRIAIAVLVITLSGLSVFAQAPPTLRIETEVPNLPSELFYGDVRVKPLRLRPCATPGCTPVPITINDSDFFVHQHYVDFLSRLADPPGLSFWKGEIDSCAGNPTCVEIKRINVSAAFFLSIEFQETGFLVYRIRKAAFGNLPGSPVPVVRETFMPETRTIGFGVVVNQQGWEALLEANKQAFVLGFVQRPDFQTAYPANMTAAQFVDQMDTNAGLVLSSSERSTLIGQLSPSPASAALRAGVLRAIAENSNLQQREFNKAFVLMQYYSYLGRNPNAMPDNNFAGWQFWLNKLNEHNGNFVTAEMVKAFIVSGEYNARF
ncbi:MAG: hypothetical protein ND895_18965 [Pyrinomonadaceae bacterium]|nr:hypothetical protein [Pyrinomonadaceae bacterium]